MQKEHSEGPGGTERPSNAETIAQLHEVIRTGSSSPAYVETGDGERFVLKLAGAGAGRRGLLTEFLANGIAERVGLSVPPARPLFLPENFPWQVGTDEFDDLVQRSSGWNLGIAVIPDAGALGPGDLADLPPNFLSHLALADRLLQNVDRTAKNPNLLRSPQGTFAIDHGSCLFVNRIALGRGPFPFALPANHFLAGTSRATESADLGSADVAVAIGAAPSLIEACPAEWLATLPFGQSEFERRLIGYLEAFSAR